ncbi:hypothetical protein HPP92_000791 [Vanilla planifolia]|uniref:Uncharacterized protein n=1 Tax=Vanilla planifolia TaxID=51239 RepID=A0A835RPI3_VANPL|nr:hypothetical protein HPP92_000791 [Vanilla planifolia]
MQKAEASSGEIKATESGVRSSPPGSPASQSATIPSFPPPDLAASKEVSCLSSLLTASSPIIGVRDKFQRRESSKRKCFDESVILTDAASY